MDKGLEELLEVFGSEFSLEDIAFAYSQTRQDKNLAAEILCTMHGSSSTTVTAGYTEALELPSKLESQISTSSEISFDNVLDEASDGQEGTKELLSKRCSASMGNVSSIIGKEYANPRPSRNGSMETKKPLKLQCEYLPISENWEEKDSSSMAITTNYAQPDVEEFLFKMLGEGFQLDRHKIQEVLGLCGYDMQKSIDKLFDLSVVTMERREDTGMAAKNVHLFCSTGTCSDQKSVSLQEPMHQLDSVQSDGAKMKSKPKAKREKGKTALEKELLRSLFDLPDRSEEAPTRIIPRRVVKKPNRFCKLVVEPPNDDHMQDKSSVAESIVSREEVDDNSYDVLREAVKEYRNITKEYYKSAIDAFTQGDHARANKLLEKGQFFSQRARETDNESHEKLLETREDEVMPINLHELEPKEAVRVLRLHLTSLSGIPNVKYLRLVVNRSDGDSRKEARKKLQLEKEAIQWEEEENGDKMLIKVDVVDPKRLSFAKKEGVDKGLRSRDDTGYYF
ncbi:putative nuclear RNA export factor SDE5 isoform X2 [Euphorbia lathyris]|uniref:putative nuclear RNA export factor SDE5 isoform X2 n=1 Tax=Euphorbia lathyris TaxID=212925 RepID=UPI003313857A